MKEVLLAQRLADNEKPVRDRALKKLRKYLSIKSSDGPGISDEDAIKIWKGLFYCMYMADKPLVQEALAEDISGLIHSINNRGDCRSFVKAGFLTFAREWNGIDVFRIDKYMLFVRRFLRQVFVHLRSCKWDLKEVVLYATILETTVVCPEDNVNKTAMGLKFHVCDLILEELAKVGGEDLKHEVILAVIQPYFKVLALTKTYQYSRVVCEGIIRHLIRQSTLAQEEEARSSGPETEDDMAEDDAESEDGSDEAAEVLDPRAGLVDACIPHLKPDFSLLADSLQSIGAVPKVRRENRDFIYKLVSELRDVAQGYYPLAATNERVDDDVEVSDSEVEKAIVRLQNFKEKLSTGQKVDAADDSEGEDVDEERPKKSLLRKKRILLKKKRLRKKSLKMKKMKMDPSKGLCKSKKRKLDKHQRRKEQKRVKAVENMLKQVVGATGIPHVSVGKPPAGGREARMVSGFAVTPVSEKKINGASKVRVNSFVIEASPEITKKRRKSNETLKTTKKRRMYTPSSPSLDSQEGPVSDTTTTNGKIPNASSTDKSVNDKKKSQTNQTTVASTGNFPCNGDAARVTKGKNERVTSNKNSETAKTEVQFATCDKPVRNGKARAAPKMTPLRNKGLVKKVSEDKKKASGNVLGRSKTSPWDEPLKKGEIEVFIKSRKQITRDKKKKVSTIKKRLTAGVPKPRTISINLKKNKEHEFSDYARTLRASPCIPFKADLVPKAPVLKPTPSPILIKRKLLKKLQTKVGVSASPKLKVVKRQTAADFF